MQISDKKAISTATSAAVIIVVVLVGGVAVYYGLNLGGGANTSSSSSSSSSTSSQASLVTLTGAGSTFVYPVMSAWTVQYHNLFTNVQVSYSSIGSGGGIAAFEGHTVDFGASDAPLKGADITKTPNALTIPVTIGAVTVAYNVPKIPGGLRLSGEVIAEIFAGNITMWNDAKIVSLQTNSTVAGNLPAHSILVIHRSDGSGTTFVFTGFLSEDSAAWNKSVGQGKTVAWPVGLGAAGNEGVAGVVRGTTYTIGYVELAYALQSKMTVAAVNNPGGNYILPTLQTSLAAAQNVANLPTGSGDWSKVSLLNQPGADTYPVVSFVYVFVYKELNVNSGQSSGNSLGGATALVKFLWWAVHDGQSLSSTLSYVSLPQNVVTLDEQTMSSVTYNGQSLSTT